jgi:hypothetical protein
MKQVITSVLTLLFLCLPAALARPSNSRLSAKELIKAEQLIVQLEQLDEFISTGPDSAQYKARIAKLSDGFSRTVASLPDGDVKTDMSTAVYWFAQLGLSLNHRTGNVSSVMNCSSERPGVYQKLCESTAGSVRDFLWAKSRLHMSWAKAGIAFQKTGKVCRPLDDIAVERKIDQALAAHVIELLKTLENEVIVYQSLGDFEASGKLARVPFPVFKSHLQKASAASEGILSWLPQNTLKVEISNALHSFQDGAYWWEQIDQPRIMVKVSELVSPDITRPAAGQAFLTTVPYTIAINWRHGSKYLKRAEQMMNA